MESQFVEVKPSRTEYTRGEKWRIVKNVLVLGFAFMVHFTAFLGASNLQSSVNADEALGTFTLSSIYGSLILSNIFLPVIIISWLGCKWTVALSFTAYMPFIMAQFYPEFYTMIPAGLMVGLGGGPLWCAKCTYLSVVSEAYGQITGIKSDVVVIRFFGLFFMFFQFSQVWGNLISSTVLSTFDDSSSNETIAYINETIRNVEEICGANFCPGASNEVNPNLKPPAPEKINLIAGIYLGCMIVACLIVAFGVDSLSRYNKGREGSGTGLSGFKLLSVTLKHLKNPYQILLLPITMFIGAEQAFLAAEFNAAFVSCGWGISNIGFVMICFGVANAFSAIIVGSVVKITGRCPVIIFALILQVAIIIILFIWRPNSETKYMYFLMAGLWGMADAIWLVQINALSGILFPGKEEASYSNFRLWEATGSVITYTYIPYLCTDVKLYLLLCLLFIGMCGYTVIEYLEYKVSCTSTLKVKKGKFELTNTNDKKDNKSKEIPE